MLELWKPLLVLKDKNNPVLFNEIGFKYNNPNKNLRPFVIFYDDSNDCYYYLKARDAIDNNPNSPKYGKYKNKFKGEILVKPSLTGLFSKDSYVDCSQIFKCNRELLESLIDVENKFYKESSKISNFYISEIQDKIKECIFEIPPYLSIIEVKVDDHGNTYGESLYLCDEKLNSLYDIYDSYDELANDFNLNEYISEKSHYSSWSNNRYNTGINFCKMFLNEYFPNELDEFIKIQDLEKSKSNEREI